MPLECPNKSLRMPVCVTETPHRAHRAFRELGLVWPEWHCRFRFSMIWAFSDLGLVCPDVASATTRSPWNRQVYIHPLFARQKSSKARRHWRISSKAGGLWRKMGHSALQISGKRCPNSIKNAVGLWRMPSRGQNRTSGLWRDPQKG